MVNIPLTHGNHMQHFYILDQRKVEGIYLIYFLNHIIMTLLGKLPYKQFYWEAEYLANRSVIVGVTLIWQKSCSCYTNNSYETILALLIFGR